jgi:hypothetical protein
MAMTPQLRPAQPRYRKALTCLVLTAACGALAAACGSAAAPGSSAPAGRTHSAGTASAAKASLDIVATAPGGNEQHWTLRCDPPGGTKPDPAAICSQLVADKGIFVTQTNVRVECPMIMASARSFIVNGTWFGTQVHETVIDGGCSLGRWTKLDQIFN